MAEPWDMPVTLALPQLLAIMPSARERAPLFLPYLQETMDRFGISETPLRTAHFLAQVAHESGELRWMREIWGNPPTAAQAGYEGRVDLGNTQPGDGFAMRGVGPFQVTGRTNISEASIDLFGDLRLLLQPELLNDKAVVCLMAGWFWQKHGLSQWADADDLDQVSDRINRGHHTPKIGDANGYKFRAMYLARAKEALGC